MKILVVDDSAIMRKIVIRFLKTLGLRNVVEAKDGIEALAIIRRGEIELILSDWNMPGMYGIDLLRAVRAEHKTSAIPFIMISAEAQNHQLAEAVAAGVTYYIIKPFTLEVLQRGLARACLKKNSGER
ncbi:MAG: response regulator [Proteobacteria bacterium]|nr:response regulator [Pseudomonadota bacterium]MBU1738072.1 response regulator [Pseudomonadota bacterium]